MTSTALVKLLQLMDARDRVSDLHKMREILQARGFAIRTGGTASNFVLVDPSGREIDIHAITFDRAGNGVYRM